MQQRLGRVGPSTDATVDGTTAPADTTAATDAPADTTAGTDAPADTTAGTDAPDGTDAPADGGLGEPNPATGDPIKIGFVTDGEAASFGCDEDRVATFEATVEYANEYLGGINGHPIELEHCSTEDTPAGGDAVRGRADQGRRRRRAGAGVRPGRRHLRGPRRSGIPYFTYTSATGPIITCGRAPS